MTENNTNKRFIFLALCFFLTTSLFQLSAWNYTESSLDFEGRLALMAKAGKWNPYVELKGQYHGEEKEFRYSSLSAGSYYRVAPWLKLGAFYRLQSGARHLEDWQFDAGPPDIQFWNETSDRYENLLYFDVTPRILLPWMPGRNWVAPLKIRYFYNLYNDHQNLMIRPGVTYVIMKDRAPLMNLSLNYTLYFALNSGEIPLYSHGPYLSVLSHINDWFKMEGRASYRFSEYFKDDGESWTLESSRVVIGLGLIFTPQF